jgi:uncharacterized phiE125 gp8 family phage protein
MPIDTLENIKTHLGVASATDDDLLSKLQTAADSFIEEYCRRTFTGGSFTEDHPGGGRMVFLRNYPVSAITSIHVDPDRGFGSETELDSEQYYLHADRGVIESLDGPFVTGGRSGAFPGTVRVAYSTPTSQVPQAVARAYAELIGHWYRQAKTHVATDHQNLLQETDGTAVTEYPWGQSGGFRLPAGALQLLQTYRVPSQ